MLYEVLKTAKMGAGKAPDLYTALLAKNLRRDGEVKTLSGIPPLTFPSNGTPLLGLLISGNEERSGTPTPDSPVMPQGTGERTGNLFDGVIYEGFYNDNGQLVIDTSHACHTNLIKADTQTTYTVSNLWQTAPNFAVYEWDANKQWLRRTNRQTPPSDKKITFTLSNDCVYFSLQISSNYDYTRLMLNTGSTLLPYEPYGIKIPISSGGVTTNIYLGSTSSIRQIYQYVCTGEENWNNNFGASLFMVQGIFNSVPFIPQVGSLSTHYTYKPIQSGLNTGLSHGQYALQRSGTQQYGYNIAFKNTDYTDTTNFKAYLQAQYAAGTPVTIWYVLAEPETGIVNEPLMKIGDYADTLSMEQAGVEIPTARGTNTLDVLTDVKPSEVYIKYKE